MGTDPKIGLRTLRITDLNDLIRQANDAGIARFMTDEFPHPYTKEDGQRFIKRCMQADPPGVLAITLNDAIIGAIGIHPRQGIEARNAELGYWLAREHWGKGIMTEAIKLMVAHAFTVFDIDRIFARPFGSNIRSQRALEKAGFVLEARFKGTFIKGGKLEDELIYAIRRTEG